MDANESRVGVFVRLDPALKQAVETRAKTTGRSRNAEIIRALEEHVAAPTSELPRWHGGGV